VTRSIRPQALLELVTVLDVAGLEPPELAIMRDPELPFQVSEPGTPPLDLETYEHRRQRAHEGTGPRLTGIDDFVDTLAALREPACFIFVEGKLTRYLYVVDVALSRALAGVAIDGTPDYRTDPYDQ